MTVKLRMTGGTAIVTVALAGVGSMKPAGSVARTSTVSGPSGSPDRCGGDVHAANAPLRSGTRTSTASSDVSRMPRSASRSLPRPGDRRLRRSSGIRSRASARRPAGSRARSRRGTGPYCPLKAAHVPSPLIAAPLAKRPQQPAAPSPREMISLAGVGMCRRRISVAVAATPRFGTADVKVTCAPSSLKPEGVATPSPARAGGRGRHEPGRPRPRGHARRPAPATRRGARDS